LEPYDFLKGELLLLDKPLAWTSFDLVNKVRNHIRRQLGLKLKVGHAGTLDPLATGLVVVCTGRMTKSIDLFQAQEKEYEAELTFGLTTPSFDGETEPDARFPTEGLDQAALERALARFVGTISQTPPAFSAKKVDGERAYKKARKGEAVRMKSFEVSIRSIELLEADWQVPRARLRVVCGKGTYIRSLAHDIGAELGCGAYLSALRRTRIGDFAVSQALGVEGFQHSVEERGCVVPDPAPQRREGL